MNMIVADGFKLPPDQQRFECLRCGARKSPQVVEPNNCQGVFTPEARNEAGRYRGANAMCEKCDALDERIRKYQAMAARLLREAINSGGSSTARTQLDCRQIDPGIFEINPI